MSSSDSKTVRRPNGRAAGELRPVRLERGVLKFAEGSALIDMGDTRVLVAASLENRTPGFLADTGKGWVTAEYSMLPRATHTRSVREAKKGKQGGRTLEIQRLIGRSLRAAVDLKAMGPVTVTLDCDVLQADGGTRTAAVTAAYVALVEALAKGFLAGDIATWPVFRKIAAVSAGYVEGAALLDLEYCEDSVAEVDLNIVATGDGELVEIQGTGEQRPFARAELDCLVDLAAGGIQELLKAQEQALVEVMEGVTAKQDRTGAPVPPRDERSLWGPPE